MITITKEINNLIDDACYFYQYNNDVNCLELYKEYCFTIGSKLVEQKIKKNIFDTSYFKSLNKDIFDISYFKINKNKKYKLTTSFHLD